MNDRERRRAWIAFGVALVAATIFRVILIDSIADRTYFAKYFEFSGELLSGAIPRDRIPDLSPGYLWTIALLRAIGLGVHGIRTLQIVLLSAVAAIAAVMASRLRGFAAGVIAAVLILGSRAALVNATDLEPEIFLLLFSSLGLMLLTRSRFAAGLCFGLAIIYRPVALLAAVALLFVHETGSRPAGERRRIRPYALFIAGVALPVFVVLLVNRAMTGSLLLMDPGTVFYEGMNANSTGYGGVPPRIVKDIEQTIPGPDTMHVAYRVVAARALRRPLSREEANRYWSQKAFAFAEAYPGHAVMLIARKARLLVSAYDAYDVPSMVLKDRALGGVWISWALLVPLALYGFSARPYAVPLIVYTMCAAVAPVAFFVTTRHRLPLLIGLAALGGIGVVTLIERRAFVAGALIVAVAVVLSIPGDLQKEDDYLWTATFAVSGAMEKNDLATAGTWLPENVPPSPPAQLRAAALRELAGTTSPARSFSIAVALLRAGDPASADQILERLQAIHYRPYRRTRAVSSVAYYRGRALIALRRSAEARGEVARSRKEAEGDADVLALSAFAENDARFAQTLDRLDDPFTRDWALARAAFAVGAQATATRLAARAATGCPEWPLPRDLR